MSDHILINARIEADTPIEMRDRAGSQWLTIGRSLVIFADDEQLTRLRDVIDAHLSGGDPS